jgi:small neutral amino acid transporter SnatA (MarC family)
MDFIRPLPESRSIKGVIFVNILVVIDRLTKYAIFIPLPRNYNTLYLARVFTRDVITKHGIPVNIISDRDKLFTSHFW